MTPHSCHTYVALAHWYCSWFAAMCLGAQGTWPCCCCSQSRWCGVKQSLSPTTSSATVSLLWYWGTGLQPGQRAGVPTLTAACRRHRGGSLSFEGRCNAWGLGYEQDQIVESSRWAHWGSGRAGGRAGELSPARRALAGPPLVVWFDSGWLPGSRAITLASVQHLLVLSV